MSKHLPVPADLEHLIEKREDENDRRKIGQKSTSESAEKPERRKQTDRRKKRGKPKA